MFRNLVRVTVSAAKQAFQIRPPTEQLLYSFTSEAGLSPWEDYADSKFGGLSTSRLKLSRECKGIFSGNLSLDLDPDKVVEIKRSGFAGINTKLVVGMMDLAPFDVIEMRLKGDGRTYLSSLRTENWIDRAMADDNAWHHPIHTTEGEWKVYQLPISQYQRTWRGRVVTKQHVINPSKIVGMGVHVTAITTAGKLQGPGPYKLEFDWIRAVRTKNYLRDF